MGNTVYSTVREVSEVYNEAKGQNYIGSNSKSDYITAQIQSLRNLQIRVRNSEENFFKELNLQGSSKQKLDTLQRRIDAIRASRLDNLSSKSAEIIKEAYGLQSGISSKDLIPVIEKIINQSSKDLFKHNQEAFNIGQTAGYFLNQAIKGANPEGAKLMVSGGFSARPETHLNTVITIKKNKRSAKAIIQEQGDFHLDSKTKKKIIEIADGMEIASPQIINDFKERLAQLILEKVSGEDAKAALRYQINNNIHKYDVYRNPPSIAGFLGEIEFNAIMALICGNPAVTPTGNLKRTGQYFKGKSVSIDSVVRGFGFQIKNYAIKNNKVIFGADDKQAGTLLGERMELGEIMVNLFSIYQYNQPITNAINSYSGLYNTIDSFVQNMDHIFEANATKLIGLDSTNYDEGTTPFAGLKDSFNTFFYISGNLVPASSIIEALIQALQNSKNNANVSATISSPTDAPIYENYKQAEQDSTSRLIAANKIKVSYKVILDLGNILGRALKI